MLRRVGAHSLGRSCPQETVVPASPLGSPQQCIKRGGQRSRLVGILHTDSILPLTPMSGVRNLLSSANFPPPSLVSFLKAKNVAAEIAVQLCESVAKKLEGKVMGTFTSKWPPGLLACGLGLRSVPQA